MTKLHKCYAYDLFLLTVSVQGFFHCMLSRFDLLHTKQVNSSLFSFDASTLLLISFAYCYAQWRV